jgi:lipoate-protein ligase A
LLCIYSNNTNPKFNLAAEEYLFRNYNDDVFFLYVNEPSIVIGKHQNALAEVNFKFIEENNISVIRRLSGGGAVYHDLGNLNFSFHQTVPDPAKVSFKKFNTPIVEALIKMGVNAEISERNDIFVDGFKVSGHAEHVFRKRILSHGTLLFSANKKNLSTALKRDYGTFTGKAIQSVRSKVANISDFMQEPISMIDFSGNIISHVLSSGSSNLMYSLTQKDISEIEKLATEKYSTWEWNFAYSPNYSFMNTNDTAQIEIWVEKGIIKKAELESEILNFEQKKIIKDALIGLEHKPDTIANGLCSPAISSEIAGAIMHLLF